MTPCIHLIVHQCGVDVAYGMEYSAGLSRLVLTPQTDRCFLAVANALRMVQGVTPTGASSVGKSELVSDAANALGRLKLTFPCSPSTCVDVILQMLCGTVYLGGFLCLENASQLSSEVSFSYQLSAPHSPIILCVSCRLLPFSPKVFWRYKVHS